MVGKGAQLACVAPFVSTTVESDFFVFVVVVLFFVGELYVYQFSPWGTEYSTTLLTRFAAPIDVNVRCIHDVAIGW